LTFNVVPAETNSTTLKTLTATFSHHCEAQSTEP